MIDIDGKYISDLFKEYTDYASKDCFQTALIKLAEINNILLWKDTKKGLSFHWLDTIQKELVNIDLAAVSTSLRDDLNRLSKIMSAGNKFLDDEFLQILTLRYQIELANDLFKSFDMPEYCLDCSSVDNELACLIETPNNKNEFANAYNQIVKNWNLYGSIHAIPYKQKVQ